MEKVIEGLLALMFIVLLVVIITATAALLDGFVITKLWDWFIVNQFGATPLTIANAIGLGLIAAFLTHQTLHQPAKDKDESLAVNPIVRAYVHPIVVLLIGYIVSFWV